MNITMVKVYPVQEDKLKAFVSVVFDHCFMVNDIKVIQGKDGLFLSMPSRRKKSGEFKDVAHPLNIGTRRMLEEKVLSEYREVSQDLTPRRPDRQLAGEPAPFRRAAPETAAPSPARGSGRKPSLPAVAAKQGGADGNGGIPASATPPAPTAVPEPVAAAPEKTLEEVQEAHLSDSFWSFS